MDADVQRDHVSEYYGVTIKTSNDLRTSACCPIDTVPVAHRTILSQLHPDITSRFYGCGSPIPSHLTSTHILDLGCGTGRDVYLASALVGPSGSVIGVDMLDSQLDIARQHQSYHSALFFGHENICNTDFRKGTIEDLRAVDLNDDTFDVVISNCVCNLSPEKERVFAEVFRVLKPGGEFYFSDVYADRRLSRQAKSDPVLVGECLGGALYIEDFRRIMNKVGFKDIRVMSCAPIVLNDETLLPLVEDVTFLSVTVRAFKLKDDGDDDDDDGGGGVVEDRREDYGQTAMYTPPSDDENVLTLDVDNQFQANVWHEIDSNTASILKQSRFRTLFKISQRTHHNGLMYRCNNKNKSQTTMHPSIDCFRPPLPPPATCASTSVVANGKSTPCSPRHSSSCAPTSNKGCAPSKTCAAVVANAESECKPNNNNNKTGCNARATTTTCKKECGEPSATTRASGPPVAQSSVGGNGSSCC